MNHCQRVAHLKSHEIRFQVTDPSVWTNPSRLHHDALMILEESCTTRRSEFLFPFPQPPYHPLGWSYRYVSLCLSISLSLCLCLSLLLSLCLTISVPLSISLSLPLPLSTYLSLYMHRPSTKNKTT